MADTRSEIREVKRDPDKFKAVLHYVVEQTSSKHNVGETVLHKLLYFIDFDYYEIFEESLMGEAYIKNHHGPTSKNLKKVGEELMKEGKITIQTGTRTGYPKKKYMALEPANTSCLSPQKLAHIDGVLAELSDMNAQQIEAYSHGDVPWEVAKDRATLNYELVFYRDDEYAKKEFEDEL